jgi:hypothetical protein
VTEPKVVRYNPLHLSFKAGMKPAFDGVCVRYSDYEALAAELEKEKREHAKTLSLANDRDVAAQARTQELEELHETDIAIRIAQNNEITRLREALEKIASGTRHHLAAAIATEALKEKP